MADSSVDILLSDVQSSNSYGTSQEKWKVKFSRPASEELHDAASEERDWLMNCAVCNAPVNDPRQHLLSHSKEELCEALLALCVLQAGKTRYIRPREEQSEVTVITDNPTAAEHALILLQEDDFDGFSRANHDSPLFHDEILNDNCCIINYNASSSSANRQNCRMKKEAKNFCSLRKATATVSNESVCTSASSRDQMKRGRTPRSSWASRQPQACPVCGKMISSRGNLIKHLTTHSDDKPFRCSLCHIGFNSHRDLKYHDLHHHAAGERAHRCPLCGKSFAVLCNLKEHLLFHGDRSKACDICGKLFWTQKCVLRHRKRHLPKREYHCPVCFKDFAVRAERNAHFKKQHDIST